MLISTEMANEEPKCEVQCLQGKSPAIAIHKLHPSVKHI